VQNTKKSEITYANPDIPDIQEIRYLQYLMHIIAFTQQFYGVDEDVETRLAEEIKTITSDKAHLYFYRQLASSPSVMMPVVNGRRGFLVRWSDIIYGSLQVSYVKGSNDQLAIPIDKSERLANDCGWCLQVLENEKMRQAQSQQSRKDAQQKVATLSASESQILEFMVQGLSARIIAEKLQVSKRTVETHQHHIYQILDVHSQREAVLIGLAAGMKVNDGYNI
jgi:DNA-binding CsgD family transcriptional regulator